jgi:hypothetical protein
MALTYLKSRGLASGVGGKVLQVVTATDSTERTTTSTSFATGSNTLSVSITPSSASNKIFLIVTTSGYAVVSGRYTIFRDATNIGNGNSGLSQIEGGYGSVNMSILDSPSTTSAITYQVQFRNTSGADCRIGTSTPKGSITAFEIAG